jgi:hypothetical protein
VIHREKARNEGKRRKSEGGNQSHLLLDLIDAILRGDLEGTDLTTE